ncbi:hypothetical protein Tco_0418994 [Tanacetum coccineum]
MTFEHCHLWSCLRLFLFIMALFIDALKLLGLKRLHGFLRLLLLSAAGEKITTADYNCLKTFYCQEDKDELMR